MTGFQHEPVLLEETLALLAAGPGARVVDATVGAGGHAEALLGCTAPDGRLLGIDRDEAALERTRRRLERFGARVTLVHASFADLCDVLRETGFGRADALLADLGMSSPQLDDAQRGFRFGAAAPESVPLDMRMDRSAPTTAADLLASASEDRLAELFRRYGELPGADRMARAIGRARREAPLRTAADLLAVVRTARVGGGRRHHAATLVFQALRIAVNDELGALDSLLDALGEVLAPGGRVAVIAYHSLEDRRVKQRLRELERGCVCDPSAPVCTCGRTPLLTRVTRRAVQAGEDEIRRNPRARSARLRVAERLAAA